MVTFAGLISEGGLLAKVAVFFGALTVVVAVAQLILLRRLNLVPAIVGGIAITLFAGMLGQALGSAHAFESLAGASPEERSALLAKGQAVSLYPLVLSLMFCFLSAVLGTVGATLRANLKPGSAPPPAED